MARAVELPLPLPERRREDEGPVRPSVTVNVPDSVLKAVMEEMERAVARREREPERRSMPAAQERARYNHD